MEKIKVPLKKLTKVRVRKMHLDYIAGLLSIPLLVIGLILNISNLRAKKQATPTAAPTPQIIIVSGKPQPTPTINSTTPQVCSKKVGPISISSPTEGQSVSDNPVCFTIDYTDTDYCSVVWSYRINNGSWSDYSNNAPCVYNVPNGNVSFQLRVNSTVSNDSKTLTRNFTYSGNTTPTPVASSSAQ